MEDEAFMVILGGFKEEVVYGLFRVLAYGTVGGVASFDMVKVLVEGDVSGAEVHI